MRKLLWVGDAACPSGFARATHETLDVLRETWDVTVLGINYRGDPHPYPYPIYAAAPGGDAFGVNRLLWMMDLVKPDLVVLQNDPWNIPVYLKQLAKAPEYAKVPVVGAIAVDGLNCSGTMLNGLDLSVFWTQFGESEARKGGYVGRSAVVPLGVDLSVYSPGSQDAARAEIGITEELDGVPRDKMFMVGVIGRNQVRKRLDLAISYFAEWIQRRKIRNAWLYLHVGPTGDDGYRLEQLARYFGVIDRLMVNSPPTFYGIAEEGMADTYRRLDVFLATTQGEGWGLPALEAMACGIPCILPDWSAYGEWAKGVARLVPCPTIAVTPSGANAIGGVPDREGTIGALDHLYNFAEVRRLMSVRGLELAEQPKYRWQHIGEAFRDAIDGMLEDKAPQQERVAEGVMA